MNSLDDFDAKMALKRVQEKLQEAVIRGSRDAQSVTLIAVSKTHSEDVIRPVLEAGQRVFGENRVQEAQAKWPSLRTQFEDVELHLIGPLQSNKVRQAVALFDVIHTIDRPKIARAIALEIERTGRRMKLFIQVNIGEEPQKAGVAPDVVEAFLAECRDSFGLDIQGLMCIPPFHEDASDHFIKLSEIAERLGLQNLSMGMSADFETAVENGATHIRVGSAIFGARG